MSEARVKAESKGHLWAVQIRREVDTLVLARQGEGASHTMFALAVEAVTADAGMLQDSTGNTGFAWTPSVYLRKTPHDPAGARIKAAGASLGRILSGGHPDHRTYLAFMEAVYVVTTMQEYDVIARIEKLWDLRGPSEQDIHEAVEQILADRPGVLARILGWLRRVFSPKEALS